MSNVMRKLSRNSGLERKAKSSRANAEHGSKKILKTHYDKTGGETQNSYSDVKTLRVLGKRNYIHGRSYRGR